MTALKTTARIAIAAALLALAPAGAAGAATITPTPGFVADDFTDNATCSLREAIEVANDNAHGSPEDSCGVSGTLGADTVQLQAGTYALEIPGIDENDNATGDLDVDTTNGDLAIAGAGAGQTTIDTDDSPAWADRVLQRSGFDANAFAIRDLTVTGGNDTDITTNGGGIASLTGSLTVERVRVRENATNGTGGGIIAQGGSVQLGDSVIELNTATGTAGGGGIVTAATTTAIESSVIRDNAVTSPFASGGGGIASSTSITLRDSLVADNRVTGTDPNSTPGGGGLMLSSGGSSVIRGTTISGNEVVGGLSREGGGVLAVIAGTNVALINSTVSGNEALGANGFAGGIVGRNNATVTVSHSTIGPNPSGSPFGSGLRRGTGAALNVRGSVVAAAPGTEACNGVTSGDDNVFADASCGAATGNDLIPPNLQLGPLAGNGGPSAGAPGSLAPVPTHLPALTSAAVDHVPAADCDDIPTGALTVDQRGLDRPVDRDGDGLAECDAGAVELQAPVTPPPPPPPPPSPAQPQPASDNSAQCAELRERLRKAKRALRKAERDGKPTKKKRRKVRRLRAELERLGC